MSFKRVVPRFAALSIPSRRTFASSRLALAGRAPSLSDIEPDKGAQFDAKQEQWRKDVAQAAARRDQEERTLAPNHLSSASSAHAHAYETKQAKLHV